MIRQLAGSTVTERDGRLVVATPSNPGYHWGNDLVMPTPLTGGNGPVWESAFAAEFPGLRHRAYAIDVTDGDPGDAQELSASELLRDLSTVLTRPTAVPLEASQSNGWTIERQLVTEDDWARLADLRQTRAAQPEKAPDREFRLRKVEESRRMVEDGHGAWLGSFNGDVLVSALGILTDGHGLVRYQDVETHPEYRRRGLARQLVTLAVVHAREVLESETLVIVADPDGPAIALYRSLGFRDVETQTKLYRPPAPEPE